MSSVVTLRGLQSTPTQDVVDETQNALAQVLEVQTSQITMLDPIATTNSPGSLRRLANSTNTTTWSFPFEVEITSSSNSGTQTNTSETTSDHVQQRVLDMEQHPQILVAEMTLPELQGLEVEVEAPSLQVRRVQRSAGPWSICEEASHTLALPCAGTPGLQTREVWCSDITSGIARQVHDALCENFTLPELQHEAACVVGGCAQNAREESRVESDENTSSTVSMSLIIPAAALPTGLLAIGLVCFVKGQQLKRRYAAHSKSTMDSNLEMSLDDVRGTSQDDCSGPVKMIWDESARSSTTLVVENQLKRGATTTSLATVARPARSSSRVSRTSSGSIINPAFEPDDESLYPEGDAKSMPSLWESRSADLVEDGELIHF